MLVAHYINLHRGNLIRGEYRVTAATTTDDATLTRASFGTCLLSHQIHLRAGLETMTDLIGFLGCHTSHLGDFNLATAFAHKWG